MKCEFYQVKIMPDPVFFRRSDPVFFLLGGRIWICFFSRRSDPGKIKPDPQPWLQGIPEWSLSQKVRYWLNKIYFFKERPLKKELLFFCVFPYLSKEDVKGEFYMVQIRQKPDPDCFFRESDSDQVFLLFGLGKTRPDPIRKAVYLKVI